MALSPAPFFNQARLPTIVQKTVRIIGCPIDLGASRRGTDMGPSAVRAAHLHTRIREMGFTVEDAGNVHVPQMEQNLNRASNGLKFKDEILDACAQLADKVEAAIADKVIPIVLGGDHSVAIGTQAGLSRHSKDRGLIWFDAHADFNTPESSPSGNIHGMPVSAILGIGDEELANFDQPGAKLPKDNVVLVGLRDVDPREAELLAKYRIRHYTMRDIDELGMRHVMKRAIEIASRGKDGIHVSFDLDGVDPQWAPGTGTTVDGGFTYREAHLAMEMLADTGKVTSMEFVEVNPLLDEQNRTGRFTVGLIGSLLGKAIV
jgi:arginase